MGQYRTKKGWITSAIHRASPNYGERPEGMAVDLLVIHNISLPPGCFGGGLVADFFCNELRSGENAFLQSIADLKVSAHFLISRTGLLTQFVSLYDRAWHAGVSYCDGRDNCNDFSIGIELEGTDDCPYSEHQYQTLHALTVCLRNEFPGLTKQRIVGHCDIAPGRKTDPGDAFDWMRYQALLGVD